MRCPSPMETSPKLSSSPISSATSISHRTSSGPHRTPSRTSSLHQPALIISEVIDANPHILKDESLKPIVRFNAMSESSHKALTMPIAEQIRRNRIMRARLRADIHRWVARFLEKLEEAVKSSENLMTTLMTNRTKSEIRERYPVSLRRPSCQHGLRFLIQMLGRLLVNGKAEREGKMPTKESIPSLSFEALPSCQALLLDCYAFSSTSSPYSSGSGSYSSSSASS